VLSELKALPVHKALKALLVLSERKALLAQPVQPVRKG
jgi:hypothetical protein